MKCHVRPENAPFRQSAFSANRSRERAICTRTAAITRCASRKGGRREAMAINSQTIALLRAYLERAGHSADIDGPLFRPLRPNGERWNKHRGIDADACAMRNCRLQHPSQLS